MTSLLLTLALFAAFWVIGLALLTLVRADTASSRIALTAPVIGTATTVLPLFMLSRAGVSMETGARPTALVLVGGAAAVIAWKRPTLPAVARSIAGICLLALLLTGWPMRRLGFGWVANANDDMANYVLSATRLLHNGLLAPLDAGGLAQGTDYATAWRVFPVSGARPGADIMLAGASAVVGRPPYDLFMPLILALSLCGICAVASLALQATSRGGAAIVAAGLMAVSPLATFGLVQQLLPQVWGLGIAAALLALAARPELHRAPGAGLRDIVPIGALLAAMILVYIELAATIIVAYCIYVVFLAVRRELGYRFALRLWIPAVLVMIALLNSYLVKEIRFVLSQAQHGTGSSTIDSPFGFALVPAALPGIIGLKALPADPNGRWLEVTIAIAGVLLLGFLALAIISSYRGNAAATVLLLYGVMTIVLTRKGSDFGVFKLFMYLQPFLAAAIGTWLFYIHARIWKVVAAVALTGLVATQLYTQHYYVDRSRNPSDMTNASAADLLPAFRQVAAQGRAPLIAVADNPTLAKLEAASVRDRPLYFVSRDIVATLLSGKELEHIKRIDGWRGRSFRLPSSPGPQANAFSEFGLSTAALAGNRCDLILPTGAQSVLNRRALPEGSPNLAQMPCARARNLLVFINSMLGQHFYLYERRRNVSIYQLQPDYFFAGHTISGFGRYALFRVINPSAPVRLELDLTTTLRQDGSNRIPPASVIGERRAKLPVIGSGSAHVFSAPLRPRLIAGAPYVMLDMGIAGRPLPAPRSGLADLYGRSVILDPRYLTSYVRNISLVTNDAYRMRPRPSQLDEFPADLVSSDVEYSGLFEDGWAGEDSYVVLSGGPAKTLEIRLDVLPTKAAQRVDVLLDGKRIASRPTTAGPLTVRVPVPATSSPRRIGLQWRTATRLQPPDRRRASARLTFIGLVPPAPK